MPWSDERVSEPRSGPDPTPGGDGTPLRLGSAAEFTCVRALLQRAGFAEAAVCRALGIPDVSELDAVRPAAADLAAAGSELLALLIRLFVLAERLPRHLVEPHVDAAALESLLALGLLRPGAGPAAGQAAAGGYHAPVFLYPVAGMLIASDRLRNPDRSPLVVQPDAVYPAASWNTRLFLQVIPRAPAADVLDLGTGTGIAALVQSGQARRVVAADIAARSVHFARFNALLNGCQNVEVVQGDLYAPVAGQSFDRIVANPPYMASLTNRLIFRDAGETGEALIARIVEGLPRHLRPGGTFYGTCMGLDTAAGTFEQRVRRWLGEQQPQFDVIFATRGSATPEEYARGLAEAPGEVERWLELFQRLGVRSAALGALVIHRRAGTAAGGAPAVHRPGRRRGAPQLLARLPRYPGPGGGTGSGRGRRGAGALCAAPGPAAGGGGGRRVRRTGLLAGPLRLHRPGRLGPRRAPAAVPR